MAGDKLEEFSNTESNENNNVDIISCSNMENNCLEIVENIPCPEFQFSTLTCYICNGYYGPCFEEPICATCHVFVFQDDIGIRAVPIFSEKTDDEDSGNDEPTDLYYNAERRISQPQRHRQAPLPPLESPDESPNRHQQNIPAVPEQHPFEWGNQPFYNQGEPSVSQKFPPNFPLHSNDKNPRRNDNEQPYVSNLRSLCNIGDLSRHRNLVERLGMLSNHKHMEHEPMNEPGIVERLPPEVLLAVFSHLDDMGLWSAANVCRQWYGLLLTLVPPQQWQQHVKLRWPLYKAIGLVDNWYKVYDRLISSAPCRTCVAQMCLRSKPANIEETSWRKKRLNIELKALRIDPPEGIKATPLDAMSCHWQATITGPIGSPYEGGLFYLYLQVPYGYPMHPPIVRFLTKIFHPNVSRHGDVGIDSIHHNWSLALTISKVLISVQSLLTDPFCQICMEPEVGEMYTNDREKFEEVARAWTWKYAMHDVITN